MKKVYKILPVSLYDIPGLERWLEEQANLGLFPVSLNSWAVFEARAVPGTRFRLDPFANRMGEGTEPTPEKLDLYRQSGWEYAFPIGRAYFLFYNTDPDAPELYTDYQSQGLSLERLTRRLRVYRWQRIAAFSVVLLLLLAAVSWPSRFDIQPAPLARLPLILLLLFQPSILVFFAIAGFYAPIHRRDQRTLMATYRALKEGLPPPSPGPSKGIVRENIATLVLTALLLVLLLFNLLHSIRKSEDSSLRGFSDPYISLAQLERVPVRTDPLELRTEDNQATRQFSLLAPVWYEVNQRVYAWEPGRETGYSPDPEDGRYTYSPMLDMTCFHLTLPILARPVAKAQMDLYRLVNLNWVYEETAWPETDFVLLAESRGVYQMAAVCRGGRLAVFRYAGMERLEDHLDELAGMVR